MKPALVFLAIAFVAGVILLFSGMRFPVYTNAEAPNQLALELEQLPRDQRFETWYQRLREYETPHKRLTDFGRGLMALAIGGIGALVIVFYILKLRATPRRIALIVTWCAVWLLRFPLVDWYYEMRAYRHDYPYWGDSIAIPIFSNWVALIIYFVIGSVTLSSLMSGHRWTCSLRLRRPRGLWAWTRSAILVLWLIVLILLIVDGVRDGDEGLVIACTTALPILFAALCAERDSDTGSLDSGPPQSPQDSQPPVHQ